MSGLAEIERRGAYVRALQTQYRWSNQLRGGITSLHHQEGTERDPQKESLSRMARRISMLFSKC